MWKTLSRADLDRVKQAMDISRSEILIRHAEELKSLEAKQAEEIQRLNTERAEVDMLDVLIYSFARTYKVGLEAGSTDDTGLVNLEDFRKFAT